MQKILTGLVMGASGFALMLAPAFAASLAPNPSGSQVPGSGAYTSGNCIAYYSAQVIHNGGNFGSGVPAFGNRGDEIQGLQATCGAQQ